MGNREEFLEKIANALGRRRGDPIAPPPPLEGDLVRRVESPHDPRTSARPLKGRFSSEVTKAGGSVLSAPAGVLPATIAARLVDREFARVILDLSAEKLGLREACERVGLATESFEAPREAYAAKQGTVGITAVTCAVAETGTVVIDAAMGSPRAVSLLSDVHLAVVLESQIVPDLIDALTFPGPGGEAPSARTWITGPSKTADIEGVLITGVHGPKEWLVAIAEGV